MTTVTEESNLTKKVIQHNEETGEKFILKITNGKIDRAVGYNSDDTFSIPGESVEDFVAFLHTNIARLKEKGEINE